MTDPNQNPDPDTQQRTEDADTADANNDAAKESTLVKDDTPEEPRSWTDPSGRVSVYEADTENDGRRAFAVNRQGTSVEVDNYDEAVRSVSLVALFL